MGHDARDATCATQQDNKIPSELKEIRQLSRLQQLITQEPQTHDWEIRPYAELEIYIAS